MPIPHASFAFAALLARPALGRHHRYLRNWSTADEALGSLAVQPVLGTRSDEDRLINRLGRWRRDGKSRLKGLVNRSLVGDPACDTQRCLHHLRRYSHHGSLSIFWQ
jgi:hypothetical protein